MQWANHSHGFAGDGSGANFLAKDKKGYGKLNGIPSAIDRRFVDQGVSGLGCQNFALLFMHANIGISAQSDQSYQHIQLGVRTREIKDLWHHALLGESAAHQKVNQLLLGLPSGAQSGHVETFMVTKIDFGILATYKIPQGLILTCDLSHFTRLL